MRSSISLVLITTSLVYGELVFRPKGGGLIGNYEVNPKFKYPWMVSLQFKEEHRCGGILFNSKTVISAASCVTDSPFNWEVAVKRHDIALETEVGGGNTYGVKSFKKHPKFDPLTSVYDVSVWKIVSPINEDIPAISLDTGKWNSINNRMFKFIGWGNPRSINLDTRVLLESKYPIINLTRCKKVDKNLDIKSQICVGLPEGGKPTCKDNVGGPLFVQTQSKVVLVGIMSKTKECQSKNTPGIFTNVNSVFDFIYANLD